MTDINVGLDIYELARFTDFLFFAIIIPSCNMIFKLFDTLSLLHAKRTPTFQLRAYVNINILINLFKSLKIYPRLLFNVNV